MAASDEHKIHKLTDSPGLMLEGHENERLKGFWVDVEHGNVILRMTINRFPGIDEVMQYIGPTEAMRLSQAFHDCAVSALKGRAKW